MVDIHFGITLHFKRKHEPFLTGKLFGTTEGDLMLELHDPKHSHEFIRGLVPPTAHTVTTATTAEGPPLANNERERQSYHG
jgi:hypothetical protein